MRGAEPRLTEVWLRSVSVERRPAICAQGTADEALPAAGVTDADEPLELLVLDAHAATTATPVRLMTVMAKCRAVGFVRFGAMFITASFPTAGG